MPYYDFPPHPACPLCYRQIIYCVEDLPPARDPVEHSKSTKWFAFPYYAQQSSVKGRESFSPHRNPRQGKWDLSIALNSVGAQHGLRHQCPFPVSAAFPPSSHFKPPNPYPSPSTNRLNYTLYKEIFPKSWALIRLGVLRIIMNVSRFHSRYQIPS